MLSKEWIRRHWALAWRPRSLPIKIPKESTVHLTHVFD